jgi:hypothetical protein
MSDRGFKLDALDAGIKKAKDAQIKESKKKIYIEITTKRFITILN